LSTDLNDTPADSGWLIFASGMLALGGGFNVIAGLLALRRPEFYAHRGVYAFATLHTWGWIILLLGALELVAAFTLFTGSQLARWYGMFAALLNALGQLLFIHAYPVMTLVIIGLEVLVIYALAVHGGKHTPGS
jgi:hypothetical protein